VAAAFYHANSLVYFITPGIILYVSDRFFRFIKELSQFKLVSVKVIDDVTEMKLVKENTFINKFFTYKAG